MGSSFWWRTSPRRKKKNKSIIFRWAWRVCLSLLSFSEQSSCRPAECDKLSWSEFCLKPRCLCSWEEISLSRWPDWLNWFPDTYMYLLRCTSAIRWPTEGEADVMGFHCSQSNRIQKRDGEIIKFWKRSTVLGPRCWCVYLNPSRMSSDIDL